jgi:ATP-dependent helicase HrpB
VPDDPLTRLIADPPALPVAAALDDVVRAVRDRGVAVVVAPPGTGKTTLVPPALAADVGGRVVVTQPRRIAARAAAARLAHLLGEPVGRTVGYTVRGEQRVAGSTRIEMVTTGVLLRRLQRDPDLPGTDVVVLDEVHERHLDADLTLALLVDVRTNLRDDLRVVAMSATVQAERTAAVLGGLPVPSAVAPGGTSAVSSAVSSVVSSALTSGVPVVSVPAALHPVDQVWCPPPRGVSPLD